MKSIIGSLKSGLERACTQCKILLVVCWIYTCSRRKLPLYNTSKIMEQLLVLTRNFSSLQQPFKVKYDLPWPPFWPPFSRLTKYNISVFAGTKNQCQNVFGKIFSSNRISMLYTVENRNFQQQDLRFPKSGFTYRFQIKLDFFLKRIRH